MRNSHGAVSQGGVGQKPQLVRSRNSRIRVRAPTARLDNIQERHVRLKSGIPNQRQIEEILIAIPSVPSKVVMVITNEAGIHDLHELPQILVVCAKGVS